MKITAARKKYLFTTKIEFPKENEDDEVDFVVLREPTIEEMQLFSNDDNKNVETLKQLFPKCVVDHSFTNDDGTKTACKEVCELVRDSSSLYAEIVDTWFKSIPFQSRLKKAAN
jgi:hypothetical protein